MVLIEVIIKPFKLDDVKEALEELGVGGLTITEVLHVSPYKSKARSFGAGSTTSDLVPKIKLEIAVKKELAGRVIEAICLHGSSGKTEDGIIAAQVIAAAIRIRTGETDLDALSS
jgi:nitrogen regulatory protein PII